jgi:O-antigen/teichoic acid export membrane protein
LRVLAWFLPLSLISGHYRYTLIAFGLQGALARATATGAAAALALSLVLTPRWGGVGAAAALLGGLILLFVIVYWTVRLRVAPILLSHAVAPPLASAAAALLCAELLPAGAVWARTALAVLVYAAVFVWLHWARFPDWSSLAATALERARRG